MNSRFLRAPAAFLALAVLGFSAFYAVKKLSNDDCTTHTTVTHNGQQTVTVTSKHCE